MADKHPGQGAMPGRAAGFTIVELMIVVAVVSVLALIALPVYLDYTVRSKVSEALVFMAEAKTSVSDAYYSNNDMPTNNVEAGLRDPNNYDSYDYIRKLEVKAESPPEYPVDGTIEVTRWRKAPGVKGLGMNSKPPGRDAVSSSASNP